jgi:hypothetical protein
VRTLLKVLAVHVVAVFLLTGCGSQPAQEIEGAKTAVDAAAADGGEKFAGPEMKTVSGALSAAMEEVKAQDAKYFKNYDKAKEMLVKVKADADALKTALPAKKEQAKGEATASLAAAGDAVANAKALLAKAPKGKGAAADLEALKGDVQGLEAGLAEVQPLVQSEDYSAAKEKAAAVKAKADEVGAAVTAAIEKVAAAQAAAKPVAKKKK